LSKKVPQFFFWKNSKKFGKSFKKVVKAENLQISILFFGKHSAQSYRNFLF